MGLNAVSPLMFQAIINQVVHVVTVTHGRMPATGTVSMCHCPLLSSLRGQSGEPGRPNADLETVPIPRNERVQRQKLGRVGDPMFLAPLVVLSVVNVERSRPWHGLMRSSASRGVTGVQPASCIPRGRIVRPEDGPRGPVAKTEVDSGRWVREIRHLRAEYSGKSVIRP
jgi:hypothetical protein